MMITSQGFITPSADGYPSREPCDVCGIEDEGNASEPRFGYTSCFWHNHLPPAFRHILRQKYEFLRRGQ